MSPPPHPTSLRFLVLLLLVVVVTSAIEMYDTDLLEAAAADLEEADGQVDSWSPYAGARYEDDADDRQGRYCAKIGCCVGRNDSCSIEFKDTVCYCDIFCNRTHHKSQRDDDEWSQLDCCPDHWAYCSNHQQRDVPDGPPQELREEHSVLTNECILDGKAYNLDDKVTHACNNCTCVIDMDEDAIGYMWSCTDRDCAIKPDLVKRINDDQLGWQAYSYEEFVGRTVDELTREKLGTREPDEHAVGMMPINVYTDGGEADEFDARKRWPGWISPPLNQGSCGASWAFSTASVAADRLAIQSRGTLIVSLSAQQLISCIYHHNGQNGCHPNGFDRAWQFIRKTGIVTEACYPFDTSSSVEWVGKCSLPRSYSDLVDSSCPSGDSTLTVYKASPPYKISSKEEEIIKEVQENGPVQALMQAKDDFYSYRSGVYRSTIPDKELTEEETRRRLHSVKILGWGTDYATGKAVNYWLCANSWGEKWGEDGYFRIERGTNECGIESMVVGVWMKSDKTASDFNRKRKRRRY